MKDEAIITPTVLQWARETAGMSVADAAARLNVAPGALESWEAGRTKPSYPQLENIAKQYNRPVVVFFFPGPPEEEEIGKKFRSLPEARSAKLPPEIRFLVRKAEVFRINLRELYDGKNPAVKKIAQDIRVSAGRAASGLMGKVQAVRGYLQLPDGTNNWAKNADALRARRDALEKCGIMVFKDSFGNDDYSGFCLHDREFPIIYVNNNMPKTRQSFTLFHELAHILMRQGGVDFRSHDGNNLRESDPVEEACNKFANRVLVPDDDFYRSLPDNAAKETEIEKLANAYCVSKEVILRKLLDGGFVSPDDYQEKSEKWRLAWEKYRAERKKSGKGGGNYYATRNAYISHAYAQKVLVKYYQKQIDEYQCADYLNIKSEQLGSFEQRFLRSA